MQIDWWTLALQTVNFLVVIWLLSRFLYRPVRRTIEAREAADRKAAEDAAAKAEKAEAARRSYEEKRTALDEEARKRDADFRAQMEKERETMRDEAREEAEKILTDAREKMARERDEALKSLRREIAGLATALACKALKDLPADPEEEIARAAERIDALPEAERADLARDLDGEGAVLTVVTATLLPDPAGERWRTTLSKRFGPKIRIAFDEDPALLGGTRLRFPHAVLDFSVAGRLDRAAREMEG